MAILTRSQPVLLALYVISLATSMSGMEIFSSLLAVHLIAYLTVRKIPIAQLELPPFFIPMLCFIAIAIAGILVGPATGEQKIFDIRHLRFFLIAMVSFYELRFFPDDFRWTRWLILACTIIGVYGFVQHFISIDLVRPEGKKVLMFAVPEEQIGPLVVGTFNHHLTFSNIYFPFACILSALGLYLKRYKTLALGTLLFLLCIWSQSRAAWVALPFTLLFLVAPKGIKWIGSTLFGIGLILGLLITFDPGFRARFTRTFLEENKFYQLSDRKLLWKLQWDLFKDHPWIGVGYNNNERFCVDEMNRRYGPNENRFCGHAHSSPLQILSTTGLLGFGAYIWMWLTLIVGLWKRHRSLPPADPRKAWCWGLLAAFLGFHLQSFTQWNFGDAEVAHNIMFFWALAACLILPSAPRGALSR